jgi:hypothetical protein
MNAKREISAFNCVHVNIQLQPSPHLNLSDTVIRQLFPALYMRGKVSLQFMTTICSVHNKLQRRTRQIHRTNSINQLRGCDNKEGID